MEGPTGPLEQVLELQMWAMEGREWQYCTGYYPSVDPLPADGLPIPD